MSETDKENIPKPFCVLVKEERGLRRWQPLYTSLRIDPLVDAGKRIEVCDGDHTTTFDLNAEQAEHVARLLST